MSKYTTPAAALRHAVAREILARIEKEDGYLTTLSDRQLLALWFQLKSN